MSQIAKQVSIGLIVAALVAAISYGAYELWHRLEPPPPTWNLGTSEEWSIRPAIEMTAKTQLAKPCARSKPLRWIYRNLFGEECIRLVVEPPELAGMFSRRGPVNETAEPYRLLELFIEHHKGCLTLQREGEKAVISEAQPSTIERTGGQLVCP